MSSTNVEMSVGSHEYLSSEFNIITPAVMLSCWAQSLKLRRMIRVFLFFNGYLELSRRHSQKMKYGDMQTFTVKQYIFAASEFRDFGAQKFRWILIWRSPSVLLIFTRRLMGKLNFCAYLISRFYPTREIRENLMHAKNVLQYMTTCLNITAPSWC